MKLSNYKRYIGFVLVFVMAIATGLAVGKIFVSQNAVPAEVSGTVESYKDSEDKVSTLVQRANSGASVDSFSAIEVFEIAEYKLYQMDKYYKVMFGEVNNSITGKQNQQTIRLFRDGISVVNKISPSKGIAPEICSQTIYDKKNDSVKILSGKVLQGDSIPYEVEFYESNARVLNTDEYVEEFKTTPDTAIPYIISTLTCGQGIYSEVKKNADDTYSFEITISGDYLAIAGLYYRNEIASSAGSIATFSKWEKLTISVCVDKNFHFKSISYDETYQMKSFGMSVTVNDKFDDVFYYGDDVPELEEVLY